MPPKRSLCYRMTNPGVNLAVKRPRTRSQSLKISALNDDCLLEVFTHLSVVDLCTMRESHQRFVQVADYFFSHKYLKCGMSKKNDTYTIGKEENNEETALVLKHFAHLMLCIKTAERSCFSILNNCFAMRELWISDIDLNSVSTDLIEVKTLKQLVTLIMINCTGTLADFQHFLNACDPLKLEEIYINAYANMPDDLLTFVASRIENLRIFFIDFNICHSQIVETFSNPNHFKRTESIHFQGCNDVMFIASLINALSKLNALKIFSFNDSIDLLPDCQVAEMQAIADAISSLKNLKYFMLFTKRKLPNIFIETINRGTMYKFEENCLRTHVQTFFGNGFSPQTSDQI